MKYHIFGSRLMAGLFPNKPKFQSRVKATSDWDILLEREPDDVKATKEYFKQKFEASKVEFHYIPAIWEIFENQSSNLADVFFTLKASHVPWDKVHKKKTFYDLYLLSEQECKIIEPLYYELHEFWKQKFGEPWRADFEKESTDFFDDAVSRENVHDELHQLVAYYEHPAFKFLQEPDQTTVYVCPEKFKNVTEHIRQRVVIEEAQTLALERFILPKTMTNKHLAYTKMVEGLVDRLAPLWMTVYILNNFFYFINYKEDYGLSRT